MTVTGAGRESAAPAVELPTEFGALIGAAGTPTRPRHAVNEPMIAHWCDAMGDDNPCYTDRAFAEASAHKGIVAPPAMLDVWDRGGLVFSRDGRSPRTQVLNVLFANGYDSIVAVNTELEFTRYVRLGETISNQEILDEVSPLKQTARGPGHFVTSRHRYSNAEGDHVGDLMFRMLVFRPEPRAAAGQTGHRPPGEPDPDPALRPEPPVNKDNEFFWEGAKRRELRIQQCQGCQALLQPPGPRCPSCGSFEMGHVVASGRGRLYSFAVVEHPKVAGFGYPLCVGLVELAEGTRLVANLVGLSPDSEQVKIGMPLELCWLEGGAVPLPQFRAPKPCLRVPGLGVADLRVGQQLPLASIPITTTLVVAGAIATRDYTPVHHDKAVAEREGSRDVFLNINTSVGLIQRVVSDWAGPEAIFRSIRLRLGAPGYPGDLLTFAGEVTAVDTESGNVALSLKATDSLGDHAVASVELTLPPGSAA